MASIFDFLSRLTRKKLPEQTTQIFPRNKQLSEYTVQEILNLMENTGIKDEYYHQLDILYSEQSHYFPSKVHGIDHTARVILLADLLCNFDGLDKHTKNLILIAARYHDIGRIDDRETKEHGELGAEKVEQLGLLDGEYGMTLSSKDKDIIKFAISQHSKPRKENKEAISKLPFWKRKTYETVLSYLKDADALDRVRIANKDMQLDPSRLRSPNAKGLIRFSQEYFNNYYKHEGNYLKYRNLQSMDPDVQNLYSYIKDFILNPSFVLDNKAMLQDMYNRGILQMAKKSNINLLDLFENDNFIRAASQILASDFYELRNKGYNITFNTFLNIVSQYKDGTLDILRQEARLEDIFSRNTYEKYGIEKSFDEKLKPTEIDPDELYHKLNSNQVTVLLQESFDHNYMLYKNLYERSPQGFSLLTKNGGIDRSIRYLSGILENFFPDDLTKFAEQGYHFSTRDIIMLCASMPPEKYREIIDRGRVSQMFSYEFSEDVNNQNAFNNTFNIIKRFFVDLTEEEFRLNYKLYKELSNSPQILETAEGIGNYSIKQIYPIYTRLQVAHDKLKFLQRKTIDFDGKDLITLLDFSERTVLFNSTNEDEKDQLIAMLIKNKQLANHPLFINYITKPNRVYTAESPNDILDYNTFCIEKILGDEKISLEDAKSTLINSLFRVEAPDNKYRTEQETNIIDELYYYKKYRSQGRIVVTEDEKTIDDAISDLLKIFDSNPTISDFKHALEEYKTNLSNIQFDTVFQKVQERMSEFSKTDIIRALQRTEQDISQAPIEYVQAPNGEKLPIRILNGQDFTLAVTTVMPHCSHVTQKTLNYDKGLIYNNLMHRPLNPNNRCTSLINQDMVAHAKSSLPDNELNFAYVPTFEDQLSVVGTHDLYSKKHDINGTETRITSRSIQNRSIEDTILGTTEEHNEAVANGVIPRYIVCFDTVSEIAMQKFQQLRTQYTENGYNKPIELLFLDSKHSYIPNIMKDLATHIEEIYSEIEQTKTISPELYEKHFNKRGRNITLETVQSVNSTSYRDDLWNEQENSKKFQELGNLLRRVISVAPKEYLGDIQAQIDFILNIYIFYDHDFRNQLDRKQFEDLKKSILEKIQGQTRSTSYSPSRKTSRKIKKF